MTGLYKEVPKTLSANLEYRAKLRRAAEQDAATRRRLVIASRNDVLWWINTFAFIYEPRPRIENGRKLPHVIPFITWPHQDKAILQIREHLGFKDIGVDKSRGEGASWIGVILAVHDWLFNEMTAIGLVSRNEMAVDNQDDPDSLMWKIDWELTKLPSWMGGVKDRDYKRSMAEHTLKNLRNGSTIAGYAATGDVASGGRKKWFLMDELSKFPRGPDREAMASTQHVTNSRLIPSTPKGSEGAFYELMHEPSDLEKVVLDWKDNPTRNQGLYEFKDNKPVAVDPLSNPLPAHYNPPDESTLNLFSRLRKKGFKLDGRRRSPWYDHECDRSGATPQNIAQELDRDYGGSMYKAFGNDFFKEAERTVRPPSTTGVLSYNLETLAPTFEENDGGPLHLWCKLDHRNRPPAKQYVLGADISTGLGGSYTSNSVVTVFDQSTLEQVAEFVVNTMPPSDFADYCISLAKWFHDGYLCWEANGPGAGFGKRVIQQNYGNVFHRPANHSKFSRKKSKDVGWWSDTKSKQVLFQELSRLVRAAECKLRSSELVKECGQYIVDGEQIEHVMARTTTDDSSKGKAHGDRVIACGVALQALRDRPVGSQVLVKQLEDNPPLGTMAFRQKEYDDAQKDKDGDGWDTRSMADLASGETGRFQ